MTNEDMVKNNYKNADNLNMRISIHEKYSKNKMGFGNWIISNYKIKSDSRILELGCGTGDMWKDHLNLLENESELILTDFSGGMIESARSLLGEKENLMYKVVNIEEIPFEDHSFDIVIANMMLYHVPDLYKALSEVKRVLKKGGTFYCATYGEYGIMPFLASVLEAYGIKDNTRKSFTLQNGVALLNKYFSEVKRIDYEDSLEVTDVKDIVDYIYSLPSMADLPKENREKIMTVLSQKMENNILVVPKEYGMFISRNI